MAGLKFAEAVEKKWNDFDGWQIFMMEDFFMGKF